MPRSKQTPISTGTREALILAGERLFAEHGINGVSLRQINADAGQKNSSAAHYHFGSKQALIKAIHGYRLERVNRRRHARLEKLHKEGDEGNVRAIVETIVHPIVEEIHENRGRLILYSLSRANRRAPYNRRIRSLVPEHRQRPE